MRFDFYGLYNGVLTMYDRDTQSVWLQVGGRAVKGPLLGTVLRPRPLLDTTWREWKKLHPNTLVMAPEARYRDCYEPNGTIIERGFTKFPAPYFKRTLTYHDKRLPMFDMVLAVSLPSSKVHTAGLASSGPGNRPSTLYRAYPVKGFKGKCGVVNDVLGTTPLSVFFLANTVTMTAFSRVVDGQTLTLQVRKGPRNRLAFYDKETGTRWNIEGRAEEGPLTGKELHRLDSYMSEWYGWVAYFPQTTIYGLDSMTP